MTVTEFQTWPDAYDYCREANRPVLAKVGDEVLKIYPSGHSRKVTT